MVTLSSELQGLNEMVDAQGPFTWCLAFASAQQTVASSSSFTVPLNAQGKVCCH